MVNSGSEALSRLNKYIVARARTLKIKSASRCSPTVFYRNCWMHRLPGVLIDVPLSRSRGAHLVNYYYAKTARQCSRTCCLRRNDTCNIAVFKLVQDQSRSNCFHLNCPSQESCIMRRKIDFILFNVTRGQDPDLLIFGNRRIKGREPSFRFSTNASRFNNSEYLGLEKQRHHNRYISLPSQATLPTYNWNKSVSLPPQIPLPSIFNLVSSNDSQNISSGASRSRTYSPEPSEAPALVEGDVAIRIMTQGMVQLSHFPAANYYTQGSAYVTPTSNILPLNQGNTTKGTSDKNQTIANITTPSPWQLGPEVLLTPLLMISLITLTCLCTLLWIAAQCRKNRGYCETVQPGDAG
ncbi:uncharacterized protein LOC125485342 [Rhincodon typus]|uniref:uncharacterized protein LOC125485342 n=1 Tax=Rhincodon typus TaxID=259920 RepID=UPI00202EFB60|nr:uncharacterized protein LOC125485342 [Rhincodon typus]